MFNLFKKIEEKKERIIPVLPEEIYKEARLELQDIIAPSALEINSSNVKLGEKICRTIFVFSYPRFVSTGWLSPIINLDKIFDISIFAHPLSTGDILKKLQRKVAEVQSQISEREDKGFVRDPVLDTAYQDLENLRDELQQAREKIFDVGLYITIYGDNIEELNKTETEIRAMLESRLVYTKPALFEQKEGLESVFPLGTDKLMVNSKLNTSPLSSVFPFISFDLTSNKGIMYGVNRHNNSLILFDRFS